MAFKEQLSDRYNLDFSLDLSIYPQFGTPNGGKPVDLFSSYANVTWKPFTDTAGGSGEFNVTFGEQQDSTSANTGSQSTQMGLISYPNDWLSNNYSWSTVAYTHTLPGVMKVLSITVCRTICSALTQTPTQPTPRSISSATHSHKMPRRRFRMPV